MSTEAASGKVSASDWALTLSLAEVVRFNGVSSVMPNTEFCYF